MNDNDIILIDDAASDSRLDLVLGPYREQLKASGFTGAQSRLLCAVLPAYVDAFRKEVDMQIEPIDLYAAHIILISFLAGNVAQTITIDHPATKKEMSVKARLKNFTDGVFNFVTNGLDNGGDWRLVLGQIGKRT